MTHHLLDRDSIATKALPFRPAADIIDIRALLTVLDSGDADQTDINTAWQDDALCAQADPEAFFPEKGGSTREAKAICTRCPAIDACLQHALAYGERFGIWGGLSERERRRLERGIAVDLDLDLDDSRRTTQRRVG